MLVGTSDDPRWVRSREAMLAAARELLMREGPAGVTVNAVHPGIAATPLVDDIVAPVMRPFLRLIKRSLLTPAQGAAATLHVATAPELAGVTGCYFNRTTAARTPAVSYDHDLQERVRDASIVALSLPDGSFRG